MNIVLTPITYDTANIFYSNPIKNNIIENGKFMRIIYSNSFVSLNNILIIIPIVMQNDKQYTRYTCHFDPAANTSALQFVRKMEEELLERSGITHIPPKYSVSSQLETGQFKYITNYFNKRVYALKISGICITDASFFLTFKFIQY